jgi:hypothetical protein
MRLLQALLHMTRQSGLLRWSLQALLHIAACSLHRSGWRWLLLLELPQAPLYVDVLHADVAEQLMRRPLRRLHFLMWTSRRCCI